LIKYFSSSSSNTSLYQYKPSKKKKKERQKSSTKKLEEKEEKIGGNLSQQDNISLNEEGDGRVEDYLAHALVQGLVEKEGGITKIEGNSSNQKLMTESHERIDHFIFSVQSLFITSFLLNLMVSYNENKLEKLHLKKQQNFLSRIWIDSTSSNYGLLELFLKTGFYFFLILC